MFPWEWSKKNIGWATPMPFASINPTISTKGPIHEILAEIAQLLAKLKNSVFLSRPFWIFFFKKKIFFCFIPMETCQSLLVSKDFSKFWWLPWFPAPNSTCLNICNTVYMHTFLYRQGETDKHITNECYELWHVTFLLPKGSAYTSKFSTMILRLLKAFFGLISSIFEGFWCSVLIKAIWVP